MANNAEQSLVADEPVQPAGVLGEEQEAEPAPETDLAEGEQPATDEGDEPDGADADVEYEEIEFGGRRYAVPKELKDGFLMQGDYTRKTQEIAAQRRELEERDAALKQQAEAWQQNAQDRAAALWLDHQIAQYQRVDWKALEGEDPTGAMSHWRQFQQYRDQRDEITSRIEKAERERHETAAKEFAKRVEETQRTLQREIKGWGPDIARQLTEYGFAQGFTQAEIEGLNTDARAIKALHKAYLYDQLIRKQQQGQRATAQATAVKPLASVSRRVSRPVTSAEPSDRDDDETWVKKRNAQLRKQRMA